MEHAKRAHVEPVAVARESKSGLSSNFQTLCNDSSLFSDFGHFEVQDSGYTGSEGKWKLTAQRSRIQREDQSHYYDCWYSA